MSSSHGAAPTSIRASESTLPPRETRFVVCAAVASCGVFVSVGGRIAVGELAALLLLPILWVSARQAAARHRAFDALILAFVVFALGFAVSEVARSGPVSGWVPDLANIGFVIVLVILLLAAFASDSSSSRSGVLVLLSTGLLLGAVLTPPADVGENPWKLAFGFPATLLALALLDRTRATIPLQLSVSLALVGVHLLADSRGLALFTAIAAAAGIVGPSAKLVPTSRGGRRGSARLVVVGAVVIAMYQLYVFLAERGSLGDVAKSRLAAQSGDYGFVVSARKDFIFSLGNWLESPWLGLGSQASGFQDVQLRTWQWFIDHQYVLSPIEVDRLVYTTEVSLHSVALTLLVWVGVVAVPLVLVVVMLLLRGFVATLQGTSLAMRFLSIFALWTFMFSPLGDVTRVPLAAGLAIGLASLPRRRHVGSESA